MHFVSIPTVPAMHVFLSRIRKHMHSNGHLEHQKCIQTVPEMHLFLSRTGKQMHSYGHLEAPECIS